MARACPPVTVVLSRCGQEGIAAYLGIAQVTTGGASP